MEAEVEEAEARLKLQETKQTAAKARLERDRYRRLHHVAHGYTTLR